MKSFQSPPLCCRIPQWLYDVRVQFSLQQTSTAMYLPDVTSKICKVKKGIAKGCAIAQAVSRWLPTAAARVRARVWSCGICGGQRGSGASFLRVLRFPLPIFILPISPLSPSSIIWAWYNMPVVAAVPSELSLTPLTIKKKEAKLSL
jgi:hypothetical protein